LEGWGFCSIEAEAAMLGQPIYMLIPEVVGFRLTGRLPEGATATDLVLTVTQMLREHGVVGKFVEFFGPGLLEMPVANRATISNMAPEYGATIGYFPVDEMTLKYMQLTGRDEKLIGAVETYCRRQGLWHDPTRSIDYSALLELDMGTVEPSLAGPKRPQDRIGLAAMKEQWEQDLSVTFGRSSPDGGSTIQSWSGEGGRAPAVAASGPTAVAEPEGAEVTHDGETFQLHDGAVVIAAITSCTNTSNPGVMLGAGLVARKALERGLSRKPWVKTSLAPGSKVVTEYLTQADLLEDLERMGFYIVGYGCTTCIGNSGPLPEAISQAINEHDIIAASVLSGNRNFEGRIHPDCRANYLASPPLVVAYAIAGTVDIDLATEPLGHDTAGKPVFLRDIWPSQQEVQDAIDHCVTREQYVGQYANVFDGSDEWQAIETTGGALYEWSEKSSYIQEPPFVVDMDPQPAPIRPIESARCLIKVGDSVTTDHISPAGAIRKDSPAGSFLLEREVPVSMFNSYGSRRGNDRIMTRGTFANIRVRNQLAPGTEGGLTTDLIDGEVKTVFDAAMHYQAEQVPLIVLAGRDYGMGSSRDWAAKGTLLLGVRAVIARSFERIHRSNLVFMGVLPLTFAEGQDADTLGLDGHEKFAIEVPEDLRPRQTILVRAERADGSVVEFDTICRVDTPVEVDYYRNGGILHTVLRNMNA
jgi:aconitate hydratase